MTIATPSEPATPADVVAAPLLELNDLLRKVAVDPIRTMVMRHVPTEPPLRKVLPWLAAERPELYNAYQSAHGAAVENRLARATHLASFVGHEPGRALFVGLYQVAGHRRITREEFYAIEANQRLDELGAGGPEAGRQPLWFDLRPTESLATWKGRLVVAWPVGRTWARRADTNTFTVHAIYEESALAPHLPKHQELSLTWQDLRILPMSWQHALSQWRGIYYIFDTKDKLGYVGSAYGVENILARWRNYAATGHGGNSRLRQRDPQNFVFSVLQLVAQDMDASDVIALESSWKLRLSTREHGLNDN